LHSGRRKGGLPVIDASAPDDADLRAADKQRCPLIRVSRTCAADGARSEKCQELTRPEAEQAIRAVLRILAREPNQALGIEQNSA
jgi:hypothetical protein